LTSYLLDVRSHSCPIILHVADRSRCIAKRWLNWIARSCHFNIFLGRLFVVIVISTYGTDSLFRLAWRSGRIPYVLVLLIVRHHRLTLGVFRFHIDLMRRVLSIEGINPVLRRVLILLRVLIEVHHIILLGREMMELKG